MILRTMVSEDLEQLKKIHEQFYKNEFPFPDFTKFLFSLVVVENDQIITGGGLVAVPEAVILTDKNHHSITKMKALLEFFSESIKRAQMLGANQMHAFIQDPKWESHLRNMGFDDCKGKALFLNF